MKVDYLIVGSGLTGSTVARRLTDAGRDVLVVERRNRIGGNVADEVHEPSGILYNLHGPHYFRTNSDRIWEWVGRFADFRFYEARVMTLVDGKLERWPIQRKELMSGWVIDEKEPADNFEHACLQRMPQVVYDKLVKPYTELQWGVPAHTLSADLASRIPIRDGDTRLSTHKHQGLPVGGYSRWVSRMLDGVPVLLNFDGSLAESDFLYQRAVWTGPIDAYFQDQHGKLRYRTQRRENTFLEMALGLVWQDAVQINNPAGPHIRTIEWKHIQPDRSGTLLTKEYTMDSESSDTHEYPFPDAENAARYRLYAEDAKRLPNVTFCGRLGAFQYLDMDQAIAAAHKVADKLLEEGP